MLLESGRYDNINYIDKVRERISILLQMDVMVVASRDETCSIVALEEAIMLMPFIVAENVCTKYMIKRDIDIIVLTGDIFEMKEVLMKKD